jgi:hypothetical protein
MVQVQLQGIHTLTHTHSHTHFYLKVSHELVENGPSPAPGQFQFRLVSGEAEDSVEDRRVVGERLHALLHAHVYVCERVCICERENECVWGGVWVMSSHIHTHSLSMTATHTHTYTHSLTYTRTLGVVQEVREVGFFVQAHEVLVVLHDGRHHVRARPCGGLWFGVVWCSMV